MNRREDRLHAIEMRADCRAIRRFCLAVNIVLQETCLRAGLLEVLR